MRKLSQQELTASKIYCIKAFVILPFNLVAAFTDNPTMSACCLLFWLVSLVDVFSVFISQGEAQTPAGEQPQ